MVGRNPLRQIARPPVSSLASPINLKGDFSMNDNGNRRLNAPDVGIALACFATCAVAGTSEEVTENGPAEVLETVVVTAQKREQDLQDVPVTVTAISAQLLQDTGVRDIKDLSLLAPGLLVTSSSNEVSTTARIRGIGTVGDNIGLESSVGVVIDGVYRPRNGVGFGDLGELQRIEVLKGPQGTLFGKNTSAGVITIITDAPSFTPGLNFEPTPGNYGAMGVSGPVTGPITDQLAFRLYAGRRVRDGFYDVDVGDGPRTERDDNNQDYATYRGQLLWLPNDNTS